MYGAAKGKTCVFQLSGDCCAAAQASMACINDGGDSTKCMDKGQDVLKKCSSDEDKDAMSDTDSACS